jgi:hypothetical protein
MRSFHIKFGKTIPFHKPDAGFRNTAVDDEPFGRLYAHISYLPEARAPEIVSGVDSVRRLESLSECAPWLRDAG